MFLYPYKIFSTSRNKRLYTGDKIALHNIYDCDRLNYKDAQRAVTNKNRRLANRDNGSFSISVLLGEVRPGIYLNCLDLDGCRNDDGSLTQPAKDLLEYFNEDEWEYSSSGTGGHIFILTSKEYEPFTMDEYFGEGAHKDLEFFPRKKHIVTTTFDFLNTNLELNAHNDLIEALMDEKREQEELRRITSSGAFKNDILSMFEGQMDNTEAKARGALLGREPITDMYTLRRCGYKDEKLIELIDADPSSVDQSAHDCALIAKLLYYTLSSEDAWNLATKTNYYQHKDEKHKKKFHNELYRQRTNDYIAKGRY